MLTLNDLKEQGLSLSKNEAIEIAPLIREASHNGAEMNVIYLGNAKGPAKEKGKVKPKDESNKDDSDNSGKEDRGDGIDAPFTFAIPPASEHHMAKKKRLKEANLVEHETTQEDLDAHPELAAADVQFGDTIEIPA